MALVHNHGLGWCPERRLPDGRLRGACLPDLPPLERPPTLSEVLGIPEMVALCDREVESMGSE